MDVLGTFINNPALQSLVLGLLVKWATDRLKVFFKSVDQNGVPEGYKVPLQIIVIVCTAIATMADLALKGQLQTYPVELIGNFIITALSTYSSALGIHFGSKIAIKEISKDKESK